MLPSSFRGDANNNINEEEKQMIPIKTMCKTLDKDKSLPKFTIENGTSKSGVAIDVIDLCNVDGVDITTSNDYDEYYYPLPFSFPVNRNFSITSMVFLTACSKSNFSSMNF